MSMDDDKKKLSFISNYFSDRKREISKLEGQCIDFILEQVATEFKKRKYVLGLAIDFILLAQALDDNSGHLKDFRATFKETDIYKTFPLVEARAGTQANTLTLVSNGKQFGIRKFEENVADFFHGADRSDYPSAYVYNTGQWKKYVPLLEKCFCLSYSGRYQAIELLIDFGFHSMEKNIYFDRQQRRERVFESIIEGYPRGNENENGGLILQAIAFGYILADRPHLHVIADKVRTGSARQKRIGDIDCYNGLDLEYSVEVKDFEINAENFERQVGEFVREVERKKTCSAIFCSSYIIEDVEKFDLFNTAFIDQNDLQFIVSTWDWQKQEKAVAGMLHYIAHIEQNALATTRLLNYIRSIDPKNMWLEFSSSEV